MDAKREANNYRPRGQETLFPKRNLLAKKVNSNISWEGVPGFVWDNIIVFLLKMHLLILGRFRIKQRLSGGTGVKNPPANAGDSRDSSWILGQKEPLK